MTSRALVVGVAHTQYDAAVFGPLPGADSDAAEVSELLNLRGCDDVLRPMGDALDAGPMKESLLALVKATAPGDVGIFYFSGHGWRFPDKNKDEEDQWDECLVFADEPIGDDWFGKVLWPAAKQGSRFVVVTDACHSASATLAMAAGDELPDVDQTPSDRYYRVILAACRDEQVAIELASGDDGSGVVTMEMLDAVRRTPTISHRALWQQVGALVPQRYGHTGVGEPVLHSVGPDDALLDAVALSP